MTRPALADLLPRLMLGHQTAAPVTRLAGAITPSWEEPGRDEGLWQPACGSPILKTGIWRCLTISTISFAPSVDALCDALAASGRRLSVIMRQVTDASPTAVGTWTIGETAQHVSGSAEYLLAAARGEAELERIDEVEASNARALAENPERDPQILADRFDRGEEALVAYARKVDGDPVVSAYVDVEVPLSALLGLELW